MTKPTPSRRRRRTVLAIVLLVAPCLACVAGVTLSLATVLFPQQRNTALASAGCGRGQPVDPAGVLPRILSLSDEQVRNAAIIVKAGQDLHLPPRGWVIGVATALQESHLTNLPDLGRSNDHDSIGLFQQRPSQGWGTREQLADAEYQSRRFFEKLLTVPDWQELPLTMAAQRVQRSAYPDAYADHEAAASRIVDALTGGAARAVGDRLAMTCGTGPEIAASGWTAPVVGPITSGFRTIQRPFHNGVDIGAAKGTTIRAAAAGIVLVATCEARLGGRPFSCDRDGDLSIEGCGWYVDILHANDIITRYCHQLVRPYVHAGDRVGAGEVIGLAGMSGNASGPHLHFEVHVDGDVSSAGAIDPVPFLSQAGVPLG